MASLYWSFMARVVPILVAMAEVGLGPKRVARYLRLPRGTLNSMRGRNSTFGAKSRGRRQHSDSIP